MGIGSAGSPSKNISVGSILLIDLLFTLVFVVNLHAWAPFVNLISSMR